MTRRTEKPIYAFIRRGNGLFPEMDYDMQALDGIAQGQRVSVDIRQWRNRARLRAYWATLQDCIDATGCAPSKEALDAYVRPSVGFVDTMRLANGFLVGVPRPINLNDCEEPEMIAFFKAAEEFLAKQFGFVSEHQSSGPNPSSRSDEGDANGNASDIATNPAQEAAEAGGIGERAEPVSPPASLFRRSA